MLPLVVSLDQLSLRWLRTQQCSSIWKSVGKKSDASPSNYERTQPQRPWRTSVSSAPEKQGSDTRAQASIVSSPNSCAKEEIRPPVTEPVVNPFTVAPSTTRTFLCHTPARVFYPWPTLAPTQTDPSSLSALLVSAGGDEMVPMHSLLSDECRHAHHTLSFVFLFVRDSYSHLSYCDTDTPWLDGKHCVFGKATDGMDVIDKIEQVGSQSGATSKTVTIADCGEL